MKRVGTAFKQEEQINLVLREKVQRSFALKLWFFHRHGGAAHCSEETALAQTAFV